MDVTSLSSFNYSYSGALQAPRKNATDKELMKVSQEFESIFVSQLYKEMNKSVAELNKDSSFLKTSMGENIFKDMLFDQYAKDASTSSPLGLAQTIYDSLIQNRGTEYEKNI